MKNIVTFDEVKDFTVKEIVCAESAGKGNCKKLEVSVKISSKFIIFNIYLNNEIISSTTDLRVALEQYNKIDMRFVHY